MSAPGPGENAAAPETSIGNLVTSAVADMQKLLRQELALAKAELREEAGKAGKAAVAGRGEQL